MRTPSPWKLEKCQCGHTACNSYFVNITRSDGRMDLEDALMVAAAPDMYEALKMIANSSLPLTVMQRSIIGCALLKAEGKEVQQ